jgi:hypothetical protein
MHGGDAKKYRTTAKGVMEWAKGELEHVGRIAAVEDPDIQYAYAQSTVNGMLHLRDALYELVNDPDYKEKKTDLLRLHDGVVRATKHLIKDYDVNLENIKKFNTRGVLGNLNYLSSNNNTKKNKKNNNNTRKNNKNNNNNKNSNKNKQNGG